MTYLSEFTIQTKQKNQWINIDTEVKKAVAASGVKEGICVVFVPHTTAAVTINENADPDAGKAILQHIQKHHL